MRLSAAALLTTLLATAASVAPAQQPATASILPPQPASCPVDLSVQQRSPTEVTRTSDNPPHTGAEAPASSPEPPAQRLEISLKPHPDVETIDSVEIRVRGVGTQRQTLPFGALPGSARPSDLQQTFHLHRTTGASSLTRSNVRVPGMNAIRWIELLSVTYTDGTVWHPAAHLPCRTEPDRFLLVAGAN